MTATTAPAGAHPGKVKGIAWAIGKMAIKPPDLLPHLEQILCGDPGLSVGCLSALIEETLELVETHMPEISTARTREVLAMRLRK